MSNNEARQKIDEVIARGPEEALDYVLSSIDNFTFEERRSFIDGCYEPYISRIIGPENYSESLRINRERFNMQSESRRKKVREQFEGVMNYLKSQKGLQVSKPQIDALVRYTIEGLNSSYEPDLSPYKYIFGNRLYNFTVIPRSYVFGFESIRCIGTFLDVGCGSSVQIEKYNGSRESTCEQGGKVYKKPPLAYGIELSPTFALDNTAIINERILTDVDKTFVYVGLIDEPFDKQPWILDDRPDLKENGFACVFSSLTMDRVSNPEQLIRNMFNSASQNGVIAMGNLFPIIPEDDGPGVEKKIIYTPEENRLTPGASEDEDRRILTEYVEDNYRTLVTVAKIPYTCRSTDGEQIYTNYWMLTCRKP